MQQALLRLLSCSEKARKFQQRIAGVYVLPAHLSSLQESSQEEAKLLQSGLLTAETQRDQLLLRVQALQAAAAASTDPAMKEALVQDTQAAAVAAEPAASPASNSEQAAAGASPGSNAAASVPAAAAATGVVAEVGVVQTLRARVAELEAELRQVRQVTCVGCHDCA